ncbi:hypothetical protein [Streptomyces sp. NPDC088812]|uniref:hypothetical protein n=1 Tax=Streptomyces sp. NPDC088812 TaxID=3365905 RepID=UPI0037FD53C5
MARHLPHRGGDWLDVFAAVLDGHGTPESRIDQVRTWAFGDVWTVSPDHEAGASDIYANDAGAALAHFRENFEDDEEAVPEGLDSTAARDTRWRVSWEIDAEGSTALGAARQVWADQFGRDGATDGDDCAFTVTDSVTGQSEVIDLSDHDG